MLYILYIILYAYYKLYIYYNNYACYIYSILYILYLTYFTYYICQYMYKKTNVADSYQHPVEDMWAGGIAFSTVLGLIECSNLKIIPLCVFIIA